MRLLQKQLMKEIYKNRVFLILMLLLTSFTSFMYFFVHFSIDGNMKWLETIPVLDEQQLLFERGLVSNTILVRYIFLAFTALTAFVFGMFYYRFLGAAKQQLGCFKSLGFCDRDFMRIFQKVSGGISGLGAVVGLFAGYLASDVLLDASRQSYLVTGVVKGIRPLCLLIGLFTPGAVFCVITLLMYRMIRGKETGELMTGMKPGADCGIFFDFADKVSGWFPRKMRLSVRLALRNPVAFFLIFAAVMVMSVMFILAYSLNTGSEKVFKTQTWGHCYEYETYYDKPQNMTGGGEENTEESDYYLAAEGIVECGEGPVAVTIAGGNDNETVFKLLDQNGETVPFPGNGELVVGVCLAELYGIKKGDQITVRSGGQERLMRVSGVAYNAKQGWAYVSKQELCEMCALPKDAYTVIFSREEVSFSGTVITNAEKIQTLERGMVSNRVSAVINQVIGCVIGCILLFLALLLNFQSCTREILILRRMGYRKKEINSLLVDIYRPVLLAAYVFTLLSAAVLTKYILRSLSIQIGDYMMFDTNRLVLAGIFILLYLIYFAVRSSFLFGISKIIRNEETVGGNL